MDLSVVLKQNVNVTISTTHASHNRQNSAQSLMVNSKLSGNSYLFSKYFLMNNKLHSFTSKSMLGREIQTQERSNLLPNSFSVELKTFSSACGPLIYFCMRSSSDHKNTSYFGTQEGINSSSHQHFTVLN